VAEEVSKPDTVPVNTYAVDRKSVDIDPAAPTIEPQQEIIHKTRDPKLYLELSRIAKEKNIFEPWERISIVQCW